ncbi:hypothetical protein [Bacillus sp. AFS053548]|uniref:hypothetical protein n=1 Tax=Bacillus sp. AFS053548 TaxID=2033505 RepID=UPI000BFBB33A|nr:hypothetical protein [Bacillus sp. AFS053548]PGM57795.1 hypothetical protein CN946_06535 [Bacillus sp. AFS053548]
MKKNIIIFCVLVTLAFSSLIYYYINNQKPNKQNNTANIMEENKDFKKSSDDNKSNPSNNPLNNQSTNKIETVVASASLFGNFDRVEDLMKDSDLVVKGTVKSSEPYVIKNNDGIGRPYTKLTFKIKHVLLGDKNLKGKTISILEYGGIISKKDFGLDKKFNNLSNSELQEKLEVSLEGIPNSKAGQNMVAFLVDDKDAINTESKLYGIRGAYKGRFTQDTKTKKYKRGMPKNVTTEEEGTELKINDAVTELNNQLES